MVTSSDIVEMAGQFAGPDFQCGEDQDLFRAGNFEAEGAKAFLAEFVNTYAVDMENFLPVFHDLADQPAGSRRVKPVGLDGKAFPLIPITPRLLADAANQKMWPLEYPNHILRSVRWPLILMFVLLAFLVLAVTVLIADR